MAKQTWKLAKGKTWRSKLEQDHPSHGKIVPIAGRFLKMYGNGTFVIAHPRDVDALMRKPRRGRLITQSQLRAALARKANATHACPMTTGIFLRIAAEAAEEDRRAGKKRITPYWRTIRDDGTLIEKFPGGPRAQAAKLRAEGHAIRPGKRKGTLAVVDFEKRLAVL